MADKPTVSITVRDEASAALDRAKSQILNDVQGSRNDGLPATMAGLEKLAHSVGREFGSALRLMGISSALMTGGLVASVAGMTRALSNFARSWQQTRFVAEEIGLSAKQLLQLEQVAKREGLASPRTNFQGLGRALAEFRQYPNISGETFQGIVRELGPAAGVQLIEKIDEALKTGGVQEAMLAIFKFVRDAPGSQENKNWIKEGVARALNVDSAIFAIDEAGLAKYGDIITDNHEESEALLRQLALLKAENERLGMELGVRLTPEFTRLLVVLEKSFKGPNGELFQKWASEFAALLENLPIETIVVSVSNTIPVVTKALEDFTRDMQALDADYTEIGNIVSRWSGAAPTTQKFSELSDEQLDPLNMLGGGYKINPESWAALLEQAPEHSGEVIDLRSKLDIEKTARIQAGQIPGSEFPGSSEAEQTISDKAMLGLISSFNPGSWMLSITSMASFMKRTAVNPLDEKKPTAIETAPGVWERIPTPWEIRIKSTRDELVKQWKEFTNQLFWINDWIRENKAGTLPQGGGLGGGPLHFSGGTPWGGSGSYSGGGGSTGGGGGNRTGTGPGGGGSAPTDTPATTTAPVPTGEFSGRVEQMQGRVAETRKGAIDPRLEAALGYAAEETGLKVRVTSGGQRMAGAMGSVGSLRHNQGRAADFDLLDEKGNKLQLDDPRRLKFLERASAAGAGGGGTAYMSDPLKIHLGITGSGGLVGKGLGPYAGTKAEREAISRGVELSRTFDRKLLDKKRESVEQTNEDQMKAYKKFGVGPQSNLKVNINIQAPREAVSSIDSETKGSVISDVKVNREMAAEAP